MTAVTHKRRPAADVTQEEPRVEGTGSPIDIDALYVAHRLTLVRLAYLLVDDLAGAEDVVQAAFFGLWRNRASLRGTDAAVGYLRKAVVNQARSALRRRRTARLHLAAAEPDSTEPADASMLRAEDHREVLSLVTMLPRRQREVLVLRY